MIKYEQLENISLNTSTLGKLTLTEEGKALGHIPGWKMLVDPAYRSNGTKGLRNRALPGNFLVGTEDIVDKTFQNGAAGFSSTSVGYSNAPLANFNINPTEWTYFGVLEASVVTNTSFLARSIMGPGGDEVGLYIFITASGALAIDSKQPAPPYVYRLRSKDWVLGQSAGAKLLMITFSVEKGLKLYINGGLSAENTTDTQPLTASLVAAGAFRLFQQTPSDLENPIVFGNQGFLDIDLSKTENIGYRKQIERFMKTKYGIAA